MNHPPSIPGFSGFEFIGRGGSSVVWKATQELPRRTVAVKVLNRIDMDERGLEAFLHECEAMGALSSHPHIVTVYTAAVTADRRPYIVMEFCSNGSYFCRIQQGGPVRVDEALRVGIQVAAALEVAHRGNVLHRDLKPGNVLINDYRQPALSDFGIAAIAGRGQASAGLSMTPNYAAPEVFGSRTSSVASDVYSLGATLYALLTGRRPYEAGRNATVADVGAKVVHDPVPVVDRPDCPEAVRDAITRMMSKDPARRPRSAAAAGVVLQSLQMQLGLPATEMVTVGDPLTESFTAGWAGPATGHFTADLGGTVAESAAPEYTEAVPDVAPTPAREGRRPRMRPLALAAATGALVIAVVLGTIALLDGSGDEPPSTTGFVPVESDDPFLAASPPPPANVRVEEAGDGSFLLRWEGVDGDDVSYEVSPTAAARPLGATSELEYPVEAGSCYYVRAIRNGKISSASQTACAGPTPDSG